MLSIHKGIIVFNVYNYVDIIRVAYSSDHRTRAITNSVTIMLGPGEFI